MATLAESIEIPARVLNPQQLGKVSGTYVSMDVEELQFALDNNLIVISPHERKYGNKAGKLFPITYNGKTIAVTLGDYENGVEFPFGASDTYEERTDKAQQLPHMGGIGMPSGMGFQMGGGAVGNAFGYGMPPPSHQTPMYQVASPSEAPDRERSLQIQMSEGSKEATLMATLDSFLRKQVLLYNQTWLKLPDNHENIVTEGNIRKSMNCGLRTMTKEGKPLRAPSMYTKVYNRLSVQKYKPGNINPSTGCKIHRRGTIHDIKARTTGKVVLEIRGVYYVNEKFGIKYDVKTVVVFEGSASDEALLRDDDVEFEDDDSPNKDNEDEDKESEEDYVDNQSSKNSDGGVGINAFSGEKRKRGDENNTASAAKFPRTTASVDQALAMIITPGQAY